MTAKVLPLFPDGAPSRERDPVDTDSDEATDAAYFGDADEYVPAHEQLGFTGLAMRAVPPSPELVPPAAASRYVHPEKRMGLFECSRCRERVDLLHSVGTSAQRSHCARCAGVVNARSNPRPPRRPGWRR